MKRKEMSKQHTPLQVGRVYKNVVFDNKSNIIADCNSLQMAEIIIKSVNNHDRLVEALEETNEALRLITTLAMEDEDYTEDRMNAMGQYQNTKVLLTKLKQQQ